MKLHRLRFTQMLPIPPGEAWDFFSDPRNLPIITPPWLGFEVTSEVPDRMYAGMILSYRVRPVFGIPVTWVTEITHVDAPAFFVDEQRFGPYRFWHHEHHFRPAAGGVESEDLVHYAMPFGWAGEAVNALLVRKQLEEIFTFRREVLQKRFGSSFSKD